METLTSRQTTMPIATIRTAGAEYPLRSDSDLSNVADTWMDYLDSHQAWKRSLSTTIDLEKASLNDLLKLGFGNDGNHIQKLANAGLIEVQLAAGDNHGGHAVRIPWEFLLSSATRPYRSQPLIVVRHLITSSDTKNDPIPEKLMVIKSNPGYIARFYPDDTLKQEEENVAGNLDLKPEKLPNPNQTELLSRVRENEPHIIHLAGIDALQGIELQRRLGADPEGPGMPDAMVLKDANDSPVPVTSDDLAAALCGAEIRPILVACNFYRSSGIATRIVEMGASAALGFQNEIDDVQGELFYSNFYLAWRLSKWKILDAFKLALNEMLTEAGSQARFAGVVLWSRTSLLDKELSDRRRANIQGRLYEPTEQLSNAFTDARNKPAAITDGKAQILVEVEPLQELNYSLLHNNRSLFYYFYVRKLSVLGQIKNVKVEVELHVGSERAPYEAHKDMKYTLWALHDEIRIPLTAKLLRSVRESVYSSLHIRVSIAAEVVYESTHRINLLPVDQWQDDDLNRKWLPSFVLPRDPAVIQIVDASQKFLVSLADDPGAGFSGYQVSDDGIDAQVQALWYALLEDFPLKYVNPPPSFTRQSQRLRTPSDLLEAKRGTCIDLALLLASCLEYIDVHPLLFLLEGHAFVGYLRTGGAESVRDWIIRNRQSEEDNWMLGQNFYSKLIELVQTGDLVPLETTLLTQRKGFWEAVAEGGANLRSKKEFEFVIDVKMARAHDVTPLPIESGSQ